MGLREKVALLLVALSFVQIIQVECGSNAIKLKSPIKMISKPKRTKWIKSKNLGNPKTAEESLKRGFNFPEVDYPLLPTFISTSYYNPKLDFTKNEYVKDSRDSMKNLAQQSINKKNRKYNRSFKSPNKSVYVTYPEEKSTQMPFCLNERDLFPSVDYPLDASELWKTHYWERILNTQPEVKQNVKEVGTNSKAKMRLSASKGITKDVLKRNISNFTVNTDLKINHKESDKQTLLSAREGIICKPISSYTRECSKMPESAGIVDILNDTKECNDEKSQMVSNKTEYSETINGMNNVVPCPSSELTNYEETYFNEELHSIAQVIPLPMVTKSSYHHKYESMPKTFSPLTTVAPFTDTNKIVHAKELVSSENTYPDFISHEVEAEGIGVDLSADEMGCTVVYPELFSSLTTSTMAPIYSSVDSIWMDPELDNHTLNTYSDEVEQYYILV